MAFPATPSNNQVHKEGNRAFVYDSALGTWDQVRETDRGATHNNITTQSARSFHPGQTLKWQEEYLPADVNKSNSTDFQAVFDMLYCPHGGSANNTTIFSQMFIAAQFYYSNSQSARKDLFCDIVGDDITNVGFTRGSALALHDYGAHGVAFQIYQWVPLPTVTLDGTGNAPINYLIKVRNPAASTNSGFEIYGDGTRTESRLMIWEVQ